MQLLVVEALGGLCNRLRALVTGAEWAREHERRYAVVWRTGGYFEARMEDLITNRFPQIPPLVGRGLAMLGGGYTEDTRLGSHLRCRLLVTRTGNQLLHRNGEMIHEGPLLRTLTPSLPVRQRVQSLGSWTAPVVGVMIRAHPLAHQKTREASPPSWFYRRMHEMRTADPGVRFFLSTDLPSVSSEVHARFPDVLELPKPAPYNSRDALQDSMADLYLLSGCTYILGSYWSSFSECARGLAGHGGYETSVDTPTEDWSTRSSIVTTPRMPA